MVFYFEIKTKIATYNSCDFFVLEVGIEPTLPKELDFESSASTNSATRAFLCDCKYKNIIAKNALL